MLVKMILKEEPEVCQVAGVKNVIFIECAICFMPFTLQK